MNLHSSPLDEFAGFTNVFSCLELVTREHPNLDTSLLEGIDRLWHIIL